MQYRFAIAVLAVIVTGPSALSAQNAAADAEPDSAVTVVADVPGSPLIFTLGIGYGERLDACVRCTNAADVQSFTGHVSVGKYLVGGLGVSMDVSVWRRAHPGPLGALDSLGVAIPTSLVSQLGNASVSFSYQVWHVFTRAGVGLAWGNQDVVNTDGDVVAASGKGVGYSLGGGITLPVASMVSLVFFGNWNAGGYDLATSQEVLERGVKHEFAEIGIGITLR